MFQCRIAVALSVIVLWMSEAHVQAQAYLEPIVSGMSRPVGFATPPGDPSRGFVIEAWTGRIRVIDLTTNTLLPSDQSLLRITNLPATPHAEQGLLGLTFDPDFLNNGYFYVYYTAANNDSHIERYQVIGDPQTSTVADPDSVHTILRIEQPQRQHNAGWMAFGPNDSYLYIATGDGGFCTDTGCGPDNGPGHTPGIGNGQDINKLLGKILRIDVHGDDFPDDPMRNYAIPPTNPFVGKDGADENWAYGLRNPWRNGFDRETGDLWIGDVGAATREEINFQPADWSGGANYGWRLREGDVAMPHGGVGGPEPPDHVPPVYVYRHLGTSGVDPDFTGNAVVGGPVYRGSVDEFVGHYFFADYVSRRIWKLDPDAVDIPSSVTRVDGAIPPSSGALGMISSFGEDANGELYLVQIGTGNALFRFATTARKAVWNGDSVAAGQPGDGSGWSNADNWTRDGVVDSPFVAKDTAVFAPGSSQPVIDLEGDRTVGAIEFHSPFTLQSDTLRVLSGNITVAQGVVATIESELVAESVNHSIRKLGEGTLLVNGNAGQTVVRGGVLGGSGTFDHLSIRRGGTVAPGTSAGTLNVVNSFNMEDGAVLSIEIGGTSPGTQFDLVSVSGVATLAGELTVSLIDSFQPSIGDEFEFLTALAGVQGAFGSTTLPTLPAHASWNLIQGPDSVTLIVALAGDFNGDGVVDAADYVAWRKGLGSEYTQAHFDEWRANFGATAGGGLASGVVPEPAAAMLALFGLLVACVSYRRPKPPGAGFQRDNSGC